MLAKNNNSRLVKNSLSLFFLLLPYCRSAQRGDPKDICDLLFCWTEPELEQPHRFSKQHARDAGLSCPSVHYGSVASSAHPKEEKGRKHRCSCLLVSVCTLWFSLCVKDVEGRKRQSGFLEKWGNVMSARATHVLQYEQLLNMKLFHMNAEYQFSFK